MAIKSILRISVLFIDERYGMVECVNIDLHGDPGEQPMADRLRRCTRRNSLRSERCYIWSNPSDYTIAVLRVVIHF